MLTVWNRLTRQNMSNEERYVRSLVGGALVMFAIVVPYVWAWAGVYFVVTGLLGTSPLYRVLGIQRQHTLGA